MQSVKSIAVPTQNKKIVAFKRRLPLLYGGQGRDRTGDTRIFSPLLYQLSYLAIGIGFVELVGAQGFEPWTQ